CVPRVNPASMLVPPTGDSSRMCPATASMSVSSTEERHPHVAGAIEQDHPETISCFQVVEHAHDGLGSNLHLRLISTVSSEQSADPLGNRRYRQQRIDADTPRQDGTVRDVQAGRGRWT